MKTRFFFFFLLITSTGLFSQNKLQISAAEVTFNFVNNDVDGSFMGFKSTSNIDLQNIENSTFEGSVDVETIKTGNFLRDWSLKGGKYFDANEHQKITFKSSSVTSTGDGFKVKGTVAIKGTAKDITIDFKKAENQLIGTTTLFTSDFDIHVKKKREQNKVIIKLVFELQ